MNQLLPHEILSLTTQELQTKSTEEIFKISGGWNEGHTEFKNGWHGNGWFEKGFVIRYPNLLDEITRRQAIKLKENFANIDVLVGAAQNGSIVASYVAKHLNIRFAITVGKGEEILFHRSFKPEAGLRVCLVDDLIFSGTDTKDHIKFFEKQGLDLVGVSVWVSRQGHEVGGVNVVSLIESKFNQYQSDTCPLCQQAIPIEFRSIRE